MCVCVVGGGNTSEWSRCECGGGIRVECVCVLGGYIRVEQVSVSTCVCVCVWWEGRGGNTSEWNRCGSNLCTCVSGGGFRE